MKAAALKDVCKELARPRNTQMSDVKQACCCIMSIMTDQGAEVVFVSSEPSFSWAFPRALFSGTRQNTKAPSEPRRNISSCSSDSYNRSHTRFLKAPATCDHVPRYAVLCSAHHTLMRPKDQPPVLHQLPADDY